jgi:hypothetical protein
MSEREQHLRHVAEQVSEQVLDKALNYRELDPEWYDIVVEELEIRKFRKELDTWIGVTKSE